MGLSWVRGYFPNLMEEDSDFYPGVTYCIGGKGGCQKQGARLYTAGYYNSYAKERRNRHYGSLENPKSKVLQNLDMRNQAILGCIIEERMINVGMGGSGF